MEHINLQAGLRDLEDSLQRMQALLAWRKLKRQEARPGEPPSFRMYDPTAADLQNEYSLFSWGRTRVRSVLNRSNRSVPPSARAAIERTLAEVERQARQLGLSAGGWGA